MAFLAKLLGGYSHNPMSNPVIAHYTRREQPDAGGARRYSYDNFNLPLTEVLGIGVMVNQRTRPMPFGCLPMYYRQDFGVAQVADNFTGGFVVNPLIDPDAPTPSGIVNPVPGMGI